MKIVPFAHTSRVVNQSFGHQKSVQNLKTNTVNFDTSNTRVARTKLADRPIHWEEKYTPDTAYFHAMYEDLVGPSSYYRFIGVDADTGERYLAVIGPAKMHDPESKFFAGTHKLPSTYAVSGKYFPEIMEAIQYAIDTWGLPIPNNSVMKYTSSDLKGLGPKIEKWREEHRKEDILENFTKKVETEEREDQWEFEEEEEEETEDVGLHLTAAYKQPRYKRDDYYYWDINEIFRTFRVERTIDFRPDPFQIPATPRNPRPVRYEGADYQLPQGTILIQDKSNPFKFTRNDNNETVDFRNLVNPKYQKDIKALNYVAFRNLKNIDQGDERWASETTSQDGRPPNAPWLPGALAMAKHDYRKFYLRADNLYPNHINTDNLRYIMGFGCIKRNNKSTGVEEIESWNAYGHSEGPYLGTYFGRAFHRFGNFVRHLKTRSEQEARQTVLRKFEQFCRQFGLDEKSLDPMKIINMPEEIATGYYSDGEMKFDSASFGKEIRQAQVRRNMQSYQDLFVDGFAPEDPEWRKKNKGWEGRVDQRLLKIQADFIKEMYPEKATEIDALMSQGKQNVVAQALNTMLLNFYGGDIGRKQQPGYIKEIGLGLKERYNSALASGRFISTPPPLLVSINSRIREGGGQQIHSTIHRDPAFIIVQSSPGSNFIVVKRSFETVADIMDQDIPLIQGLGIKIVGLSTDTGGEIPIRQPFTITSIQERQDKTFAITLDRPVIYSDKWSGSRPNHIKVSLDPQTGNPNAGIIDAINGDGQPCKMDLSKTDSQLAVELKLTPEEIADLRKSFGFMILGYRTFPQCLKAMELGRGAPKGYHPTPVKKVYTAFHMKAINNKEEPPPLEDAPEEDSVDENTKDENVEEEMKKEDDWGLEEGVEKTPAESPVAIEQEPLASPSQESPSEILDSVTKPAPSNASSETGDVEPPKSTDTDVDVEEPFKPKKKQPSQQETFTSTWNKLIRLAAELDKQDKTNEAQEIHRILRKHRDRLSDFDISVVK